MSHQHSQDPLEFVRNMWSSMGFSLPGIMTPTLDVDELDKRVRDLKAVEGWLRMNLNMLSASINALEVQRATLQAVKSFSQTSTGGGEHADPAANPFVNPALWPWNFMQPAATAEADAPPPDAPVAEPKK